MKYWLLKSEPNTWSWDDQIKEKIAMWDGVRNYQARNNLMSMSVNDQCFFYHSVNEKKIVGIVSVSKEHYIDPTDKTKKFVAVDVKKVGESWNVFTHAGQKDTGINAEYWAKEIQKQGAGEILLTSMDADGSQSGFDLEITKRISQNSSIPVIASGGGGELQHFADALKLGFADAVLAASVFHYEKFTISQVKDFLKKQNITVRLN